MNPRGELPQHFGAILDNYVALAVPYIELEKEKGPEEVLKNMRAAFKHRSMWRKDGSFAETVESDLEYQRQVTLNQRAFLTTYRGG